MITSKIWHRLAKSKKYREAFVASAVKRSIPFQITAMRKKAELSQEQLAEACGLTQGVISRAENPSYGNLTFNTLLRIAAGFDVAVLVEFVPFSRLLEVFEKRSEDEVPMAFEEEAKALSDDGAIATATGRSLVEEHYGIMGSIARVAWRRIGQESLIRNASDVMMKGLSRRSENICPHSVEEEITAQPSFRFRHYENC